MTGFTALLGKELTEIRRTWRLWVLPAFVLLQAITGPVSAYFQKELVSSMVSSEMAQTMPDATAWDSWAQWAKNLTPMVLLVVLVTTAGMVASEVSASTAVLVLTKPVSRTAFVLAKFTAAATFLVATALAGAAVTWGVTEVLFDDVHPLPLLRATLAWLLLALVHLAAVLVASCVLSSALGAAGAGLGVLVLGSLAGLWGPAARHSPAGLSSAVGALAQGHQPTLLWPVVTSLLLTAGLVALACALFGRREL